jgi:hypothetical protein
VVASHVTRVHMQQTGREGRLKSKIFRPAGPQAQPSAIVDMSSAASASWGTRRCGARRQRGAFKVYLMFDVIKGQFGRTDSLFYRLIASLSGIIRAAVRGTQGHREPERDKNATCDRLKIHAREGARSTAAAAFEHLASGTCCGPRIP